jgi:hypothetical protein
MQLCKEHWEKLTIAVKSKGLGHLISKSSDELFERLNLDEEEHLKGRTKNSFDSLFYANMKIMEVFVSQSIDNLGKELTTKLLEKNLCPLCHIIADARFIDLDDDWIAGASNEARRMAQKLDLIAKDTLQ